MEKYNFNEFDLVDIFKSVWGYSAPPFILIGKNETETISYKKGISNSKDSFGIPVDERTVNLFGEQFYGINNNGNKVFLPITLEDSFGKKLQLQNTVSSMVCKKTIVETALVGRQGTVKEEISVDDWEINVKGIIISPDMDYPDVQVAELNQWFLSGESYKIINARTSLVFGDKDALTGGLKSGEEKVVFKSLRFPEVKGFKNMQAFECDLVSDIEFKLIIE